MSQDIIVQVWKDWGLSLKNQIEKVKKILKALLILFQILDLYRNIFLQILQKGHKIILSSPWYLDHIYYGSDWVKFYDLDLEIMTNQTLRTLVLGGEVSEISKKVLLS